MTREKWRHLHFQIIVDILPASVADNLKPFENKNGTLKVLDMRNKKWVDTGQMWWKKSTQLLDSQCFVFFFHFRHCVSYIFTGFYYNILSSIFTVQCLRLAAYWQVKTSRESYYGIGRMKQTTTRYFTYLLFMLLQICRTKFVYNTPKQTHCQQRISPAIILWNYGEQPSEVHIIFFIKMPCYHCYPDDCP